MFKTILFSLLAFWASSSTGKEPLVIGSKSFSESYLLGEMTALLLEEKFDQPVKRKLGLGGTKIALDALIHGGIHVYPDYSGTGYVMILKKSGESDPEKVLQEVRVAYLDRWSIVWSDPIGFNNTYALAVRRSDPRFKGITKISQLSNKVEDFVYAGAYEYMERKDGHAQFVKTYELNFKPNNVISLNAGLMYSAIRDKKVDMIVAYSTDGRIKAYDLRLIKDDQKFFPPYFVSLLAQQNTLKSFPELHKVFDLMADLITEDEMTEMNDKVDRLNLPVKTVAREFLVSKGLLAEAGQVAKESPWGFVLKKKDYLLKLLWEHLLLSFTALTLALLVSIPAGIAMTRYERLAKIIFPFVNTVQTIPSLALLGFLIPIMGIGFAPAIVALFLYSLLPLVRNTYTGILSVDPTYIEASKGIGLTNLQILTKVEIPLALPVILAGLRTAGVIVIGTTTLAALIGAGGFGDPIFRGVATVNSQLILLGAIPSALLAIFTDKLIGFAEKRLVSEGLK